VHPVGTSPGHGNGRHVRKQTVQNLDTNVVNIVPGIAVGSWTTQRLPSHEKKEKQRSVRNHSHEDKDTEYLKETTIQNSQQVVAQSFTPASRRVDYERYRYIDAFVWSGYDPGAGNCVCGSFEFLVTFSSLVQDVGL
jgi:hypothetical protein